MRGARELLQQLFVFFTAPHRQQTLARLPVRGKKQSTSLIVCVVISSLLSHSKPLNCAYAFVHVHAVVFVRVFVYMSTIPATNKSGTGRRMMPTNHRHAILHAERRDRTQLRIGHRLRHQQQPNHNTTKHKIHAKK